MSRSCKISGVVITSTTRRICSKGLSRNTHQSFQGISTSQYIYIPPVKYIYIPSLSDCDAYHTIPQHSDSALAMISIVPVGAVVERSRKYIEHAVGRYQQHDSQEMLQKTLEALHNDLNTGAGPSTALNTGAGPATVGLTGAAAAWSQHNSTNKSVITDIFGGFLQSAKVSKPMTTVMFTEPVTSAVMFTEPVTSALAVMLTEPVTSALPVIFSPHKSKYPS